MTYAHLSPETRREPLSSILHLAPDDVLHGPILNSGGEAPHATAESRERWRQVQNAQRLAWEHGPERAEAILDGRDPATEADLAKWRELGRSAAA